MSSFHLGSEWMSQENYLFLRTVESFSTMCSIEGRFLSESNLFVYQNQICKFNSFIQNILSTAVTRGRPTFCTFRKISMISKKIEMF